jgi:hypothetical protein
LAGTFRARVYALLTFLSKCYAREISSEINSVGRGSLGKFCRAAMANVILCRVDMS